jgi:hypothetical protein
VKTLALFVRFLLEVCILASFAAWAAHLQFPVVGRIVIGGTVCLAAALTWGQLLSPKRRVDLPTSVRLVIEAGFFLAAAAALVDVGYWRLAIALLVAAVGDRIALAVLR